MNAFERSFCESVCEPSTGAPSRGYSIAVEIPAGHRMIVLAGQIALDSVGHVVGAGEYRSQATQVFENVRRVLIASGATFTDGIKVLEVDAVAVVRSCWKLQQSAALRRTETQTLRPRADAQCPDLILS